MMNLHGILKQEDIRILRPQDSFQSCFQRYTIECERLLQERQQLATSWQFIDTKAGKSYTALQDEVMATLGGDISKRHITHVIGICNELGAITAEKSIGASGEAILASPQANKATGLSAQLLACLNNLVEFNKNELFLRESAALSKVALLDILQSNPIAFNAAQLQPDDVIRLINDKLQDSSAAKNLRTALTKQYPVCMVDEFQDTDPAQFQLFNELYKDNETLGLFAIGDPKQSIYAFRGADIFAYLDVKKSIAKENIHSLNVNFRSKQGVMACVNALFKDVDAENNSPVFVYPGIEYEPVYSCEAPPQDSGLLPQQRGIYRIANKEPASLVFVGDESDKSQTFNSLKAVYAADCAERIVSLLQPKKGASVEKNGERVAVRPGDIAILVRGYSEADAIKAALAEKGMASVYLSQKDSVFKQCVFAQDLLFILQAMDDASNIRHLKAAFSVPLLRGFQTETALLDSLETEEGFEQAIKQFSDYGKTWEEKGVFAALYQLFADHNLEQAFAVQPDCDRWMTDFRHLGELLQQQYKQLGSRERLIDWYSQQLSDDSELDEEAKSLRLESDDNLVKIVTLHGCKGLEYPIVFIPFFFRFKEKDLKRDVPFYHKKIGCYQKIDGKDSDGAWQAVLDFQGDEQDILQAMNRESMAEDMRLLYVGITRAIYQCYIGISCSHYGKSAAPLFPKTCWAYLLSMSEADTSPTWDAIKEKLQQRMKDTPCAFETVLTDTNKIFHTDIDESNANTLLALPEYALPKSYWQITSYTALAHQKKVLVLDSKQDEPQAVSESEISLFADSKAQENEDKSWENNIRYRLHGGANTGDCLHKIFERVAQGDVLDDMLGDELRIHGLIKTAATQADAIDAAIAQQQQDMQAWLQSVLAVPLLESVPSLSVLFADGAVLPECQFDFSLADNHSTIQLSAVNAVLQNICGAASGLARKDHQQKLNGIMTGSIDLLFIHDKKVYVLDYKSNTLGKSPRFYDQENMQAAMRDGRYDLQYLIYSVAAQRYMQQRLGDRYTFDGGEYSFGGVLYLFLRGMGLPEPYARHGIYFVRPTAEQISALDAALSPHAASAQQVEVWHA
jgi:exodeoxyribonuclease V beta subunit